MGKYSQQFEQYKDKEPSSLASSGSKNQERLPRIPWFNANSAIKNSPDHQYRVRVLPQENWSYFYFRHKVHSFKVGTSWKNQLCLRSAKDGTPDGTPTGKCAICDYLDKNPDVAKEKPGKDLVAKENNTVMIYDYVDKKIYRMDLGYYNMHDTLAAINLLDDESFEKTIDVEGFDLYWEQDENGYAKISGVKAPKKSLEEIKEIVGLKQVPDAVAYVFMYPTRYIEGQLQNLLELAQSFGMCPKGGENKASDRKRLLDDDEDDDVIPVRKSSVVDDEDDDEVVPTRARKASKAENSPLNNEDELDEILEGLD